MEFPLLIFGENWQEQMDPFQGNNITKIDKKYLEFFDEEPYLHETYDTGTVERVQMPDGRQLSPFSKEFMVGNKDNRKLKVPKKYPRVQVPLNEVYSTFDEYMAKYQASKVKDPETGKFGYWWNPRGKWDWVQPEAYKEFLLLKDWDLTWQAKNGDIDWEGMKAGWIKEAEERWLKYEAEIPKGEGDDKFLRNIFGIRPDDDRTSFIKRRGYISVYAVLMDGEWYQKGQNGWWSNVALPKDWEENLDSLLRAMPADMIVSVVQVTSAEENEIN